MLGKSTLPTARGFAWIIPAHWQKQISSYTLWPSGWLLAVEIWPSSSGGVGTSKLWADKLLAACLAWSCITEQPVSPTLGQQYKWMHFSTLRNTFHRTNSLSTAKLLVNFWNQPPVVSLSNTLQPWGEAPLYDKADTQCSAQGAISALRDGPMHCALTQDWYIFGQSILIYWEAEKTEKVKGHNIAQITWTFVKGEKLEQKVPVFCLFQSCWRSELVGCILIWRWTTACMRARTCYFPPHPTKRSWPLLLSSSSLSSSRPSSSSS